MRVEVRPLPTKKWHGKEGKDSFTRPKVIEALYDDSLKAYATGLTEEEAREYGRKLGVDLGNHFDPEEPHPTWSTKQFSLKLDNNTVILDTKDLRQHVLVKLMKANKWVANSMKSWENGEWPFATHVIFDEEEEVEIKASRASRKALVYQKLAEMSDEEKKSLIWILSNKSLRGKSPNFIVVELDELINGDDSAETFEKLAKLIEIPKRDRFAKSTILEAIQRNILIKDGSSIVWMGDHIANSVDDAAAWLSSPDNQTIKAKIIEQLNS